MTLIIFCLDYWGIESCSLQKPSSYNVSYYIRRCLRIDPCQSSGITEFHLYTQQYLRAPFHITLVNLYPLGALLTVLVLFKPIKDE